MILMVLFLAGGFFVRAQNVDENGYLIYCPCMGRFGNQADQFLGSLAFAHAINRTLILPPWVEYERGNPKSIQVPFDKYFLVEPLQKFHRVITAENFMNTWAPEIWPEGKRAVLCYGSRQGAKPNDCNAKEGNPFGPFWDYLRVDFDKSEFYGSQLSYQSRDPNLREKWTKNYPPDSFPVLAFAGPPAIFPVTNEDRHLHKYLQWSSFIADQAANFIEKTLPPGPFVGIHLRNDHDWDNVCQHVSAKSHLFASPQCLGYNFEYGRLTEEICKPSKKAVLKDIKNAVKAVGANSVFVSSDRNHMIDEINEFLGKLQVKAYKMEKDDPHVSLAILAESKLFIGNCVSSFSAFVKRERDVKHLPTIFWGFKSTATEKLNKHEL